MAILDAFRLGEVHNNLFAFCLPTRPSSVRDCMRRAHDFCGELIKESVAKPGDTALVVGFGPTGITIANSLIRAGMIVKTCDRPPKSNRNAMPESLFRILCATTFDFPSSHWTEKRYPHDHSATDLSWKSGTPYDVMTQLDHQFRGALHRNNWQDRHQHYDSTWLDDIDRSEDGNIRIHLKDDSGFSEQSVCHLVVLCVGRGRHIVELQSNNGTFAGFGFWSNADELLQSPKTAAGKRVLILGGGDGGLSEFTRLLTDINRPDKVLEELALPPDITDELRILNREMWNELERQGEERNHRVFQRIHLASTRLVDRAWAYPNIRNKVRSLVRNIDERPFVQLAIKCWHFPLVFAANRIIPKLLARALAPDLNKTNGGLAPFRVGVNCPSIEGLNGHRCMGVPENCALATHRAHFEPESCPEFDDVQDISSNYYNNCLVSYDTQSCDFHRILLHFQTFEPTADLPKKVKEKLGERMQRTRLDPLPEYYLAD